MRAIPEAFSAAETVLPLHNRTIPGPAGDMRLRVAAPEGRPTAVYLDIHGGGFCMGWPEMHDPANARLAQATGMTVVSLDYRLAPEHPFPAGPDDCRAAADWLLANAEAEFGSGRLIIGGDSAGGNLTMHVALHLRDRGADRSRRRDEPDVRDLRPFGHPERPQPRTRAARPHRASHGEVPRLVRARARRGRAARPGDLTALRRRLRPAAGPAHRRHPRPAARRLALHGGAAAGGRKRRRSSTSFPNHRTASARSRARWPPSWKR